MRGSFPFAALVQASEATSTELLVRAAQIAARAVGDVEFDQWCAQELAGYSNSRDVPEYRKVHAQLYADEAYRRGVPAMVRDEKMAEMLGRCPLPGSLRQLDEMCAADRKGSFQVSFLPEHEAELLKSFHGAHRLYRVIQPIGVRTATGEIRRRVFDWALLRIGQEIDLPGGLRLEVMLGVTAPSPASAPIISDSKGVSFEIQGSGNSVVVQSAHVQSTVTTAADQGLVEIARELVALLSPKLEETESTEAECQQLREALDELKALVEMPKPRAHWIHECAKSIRAIAENAAGTVAGTLLTPQGQALLARLAG
jgi:hypothetical protein